MSEVSGPSNKKIEGGSDTTAGKLPPGSDSTAASPEPEKKLTPEEQMALYEKDLKENDWGHQPC